MQSIQVGKSLPIWEILRTLATELEKRWSPNPPTVSWVHIDPLVKTGYDFKVKIHYGKAAASQVNTLAAEIEADLSLNHRDECIWE
jgi:hypothetical protein